MGEWVLANHFDQIMEDLTSGVLAIDAAGGILLANRASCIHLGLPEGALHAGMPFNDSPIPEAFRNIMDDVLRHRAPMTRREVAIRDQDNLPREIGLTASLLTEPNGFGGAVFLFVDMTERRALERAAESNRQLAQIGELTAGVVHELRNPLAVISGNAELLQRRIAPDDPSWRHVEAIREETRNLERLASHFLGFAKPFQLDWMPCKAQILMERSVAACRPHADRKKVTVKTDLPAGDFEFQADENKLVQALANIVGNALDAVAVGGDVSVLARQEDFEAVFEVSDNGPGVHLKPEEDVFKPFFSHKEGGTGLGLAICRRIVTAHQGTVMFCNKPDGGARFVVRLPLGEGNQA